MRSIEWMRVNGGLYLLFVKLNEAPPGEREPFLCSVLTSERVRSGLRATKHESTVARECVCVSFSLDLNLFHSVFVSNPPRSPRKKPR